MRWRLIAPLLPGRSDDSVRNRWKRLKEDADTVEERAVLRGTAVGPKSVAVPSTIRRVFVGLKRPVTSDSTSSKRRMAMKQPAQRTEKGVDDDHGVEGGQRVSWSSYEDQVIVRAVQELGPRWCAVAARLPSRTDQAVRNRWNRLQQRARVQARTMLNQFQQGRCAQPGQDK